MEYAVHLYSVSLQWHANERDLRLHDVAEAENLWALFLEPGYRAVRHLSILSFVGLTSRVPSRPLDGRNIARHFPRREQNPRWSLLQVCLSGRQPCRREHEPLQVHLASA